MARTLPHEISHSLSQQWPCRELQIRQLTALLGPNIPSPPTLILYGISATCKSTITRAVLESLKTPHAIIRCVECITARHLLTKILLETLKALRMENEWERFGKGKCEHVSTLLILLADIFSAFQSQEKEKGEDGHDEKFVLVLDGIDRQRDASQMLLAALARLGEVIPCMTVVLIMNTTPRPLFLQSAGVSHITFPPYTRKEAIGIITSAGPPAIEGLPEDARDLLYSSSSSNIYTQFVTTVYDSLVGPTAGTIPSFRSICERLWPRFIQPILNGDTPPNTGAGGSRAWDFTRLLLRNRAMFKVQGESMLVHHIVIPEETAPTTDKKNQQLSKTHAVSIHLIPKLPSLPYFPTLVLTSAYVASHTPQRLDTIFFSKFSSSSLSARNKRSHHRRRLKLLSKAQYDDDNNDDPSTPRKGKRMKTKITKSILDSAIASSSATTSATKTTASGGGGDGGGALTGPSTLLTARPFTLERLVAIYHAIDPNPPAINPVTGLSSVPMADAIYGELATLRRLRLVIPSGGGGHSITAGGGGTTTADAGEKWCINVSGDWIGELAKGIGVEVGEWLAGGLD